MDSRNLNSLENQAILSRRSTLIRTRAHLGGVGIHGSIRCIHGTRLVLVLGPLGAIVSRQLESRDLILKHLDHLAKVGVGSRRGQRKLACGLLSVTIDTEFQSGIKLASVDSRTTTGCPLGGIQLALQTFPCGLLCGKQRKTTGRPAVSTPFRTAVLRLLNLILGGQISSLGRTHRRSLVLTKPIVRHIEDLLVVERTQGSHIGKDGFGRTFFQKNINIVSGNLNMKESLLDQHHEHQDHQRNHHRSRKDGTRHESHQDHDDRQSPHADGNGCIQGNHLLSKGHTNYARA